MDGIVDVGEVVGRSAAYALAREEPPSSTWSRVNANETWTLEPLVLASVSTRESTVEPDLVRREPTRRG